MLTVDAQLRAVAAATAADETDAEEKTDVTSPQDEIQAASTSPPAQTNNDLDVENNTLETKCRPTFFISCKFRSLINKSAVHHRTLQLIGQPVCHVFELSLSPSFPIPEPWCGDR